MDDTARPPATDADGRLTGLSADLGLGSSPWSAGHEDELAPGTDLGGVVIVRLLARGGMGSVYEARQASPARTVAVKIVRDGRLGPDVLRRFADEARALARLRHPHVAQIHACGTFASPRGTMPYIVMELVEAARSITEHAAGRAIRERVALVHDVAAAVAHGHGQGVVHRDLKPGNILVDATGWVKVIDFGVARSLHADGTTRGGATATGDLVGTLRYMSPEQLGVGDGDVDARSDVYALGLVLHEVLTAGLPYDLRGMSFVEAARILDDPSPTSMAAVERAARVAGCGVLDSRALATIVGTCLEKRPGDRYATAVEVEAELGRWLAGEAILARPPTPVESLVRFARRHRAATAAAIAILASLIAATSGISYFYVRAERDRQRADEARLVAVKREEDAEQQAAAARAQLYVSNVLLAAAARDRDNVSEAKRLLADARGLVADAGTTNPIELHCLAATLDESLKVIGGHVGNVTAVGWSPDGSRLASGASDGAIRLGTRTGAAVAWNDVPIGSHDDAVWSVAFAADGDLLATASGDGSVGIWDVARRVCVKTLEAHGSAAYAVAFSADGGLLASGGRDRVVRLWDTATWEPRGELRGHESTVHGVSFAADAAMLATASGDGTVRIWDVTTSEQTRCLTGHQGRVFGVAFSPNGRRVASAGEDATTRVWDLESGEPGPTMRHPFRCNGVAWLAGGSRLATASHDGMLRVWDADSGGEHARYHGHTAAIWSLATVAADGWVATGAGDGTVRLWDAAEVIAPVIRGDDKVLSVCFAPDGTTIATAMANSVVGLWDAATLEPRGVLRKAVGRVNDVRFSPDGETVAGCCDDGTVQLWDRGTRRRRDWFKPHERRVYAIDFSPDGRLVATAAEDRSARISELASGTRVGEPLKHGSRVFRATFSPDGSLLATACEDRTARLWRVHDGSEVRRFTQHEGPVNWVAFSHDGTLLLTACSDGAVRVWSVAEGGLIAVMTGPSRQIWKAAFSPDGRRVAGVSADGTAQIWDVATGRAMPMLRGHGDQVWGVAFAPDGRSLVTGSWDGTARVWGVSVAEIARRRMAPAAR